jgi:nucleotide-binding universal stress UspA family protein
MYLSAEARSGADERARAESEEALAEWATAHQLDAAGMSVLPGRVIDGVLRVAESTAACLVVSGSRMLSTTERIVASSVGQGLAALSPVPVALVAPGAPAA